jgi:putative membrane protein
VQKNLIIILIFSIFIAMFAGLNAASIQINLIFAKIEISAALVILISASIGAVIIYFAGAFGKMKSAKKIKELERKASALTAENEALKESSKALQIETVLGNDSSEN